MNECRADFETRSDVDLKTCGAYPYFESPHFRPLILAYDLGAGIKVWTWGQPCPDDLREHIEAGGIIRAWNASFERGCFTWLAANCGWPLPQLEQYRCTAAAAAAMGLPRSLGAASEALGLPVKKDTKGYSLIRKFSIPRKPKAGEAGIIWNEPEDHLDLFQQFVDYCVRDVETEAAAAARIVPLSDDEEAIWRLDQTINDRGIRVDLVSAKAAIRLAEKAKRELDRRMLALTAGQVTACSQVARLTQWVTDQGVTMDSAAKAEIESLLAADDLPDRVREAISIRQEYAKSSVGKLEAMVERASRDGRVRGGYIYHGAGTGRWSHTGVQTGNMPRGRKIFGDAVEAGRLSEQELYAAIRVGEPAWLQDLFGDELGRPLFLLSDALRGFLVADKGRDLVVADYAAIEGRIAAWCAGETWKLDAYVANDEGRGAGLYEIAAAGIYNVPVEAVSKAQRQVGKVAELALQYQGGVGALASMAGAYGMKLADAYDPVWESASEQRRDDAVSRFEDCIKRNDTMPEQLGAEGWLAAELIKAGWRATNPAIKASWKLLEDAIKNAVNAPGTMHQALNVFYTVKLGFLWCRLPSGRCLAYGAPRFSEVEAPWADKTAKPEQRETHTIVTALGVNSVTKKWQRFGLYGGLAFENIVQAIARDCLAAGMLRAEAAGYAVIGHVHDEIITEVPAGFGDVQAFEREICKLPSWAAGLPLTASGFRSKRYRK